MKTCACLKNSSWKNREISQHKDACDKLGRLTPGIMLWYSFLCWYQIDFHCTCELRLLICFNQFTLEIHKALIDIYWRAKCWINFGWLWCWLGMGCKFWPRCWRCQTIHVQVIFVIFGCCSNLDTVFQRLENWLVTQPSFLCFLHSVQILAGTGLFCFFENLRKQFRTHDMTERWPKLPRKFSWKCYLPQIYLRMCVFTLRVRWYLLSLHLIATQNRSCTSFLLQVTQKSKHFLASLSFFRFCSFFQLFSRYYIVSKKKDPYCPSFSLQYLEDTPNSVMEHLWQWYLNNNGPSFHFLV